MVSAAIAVKKEEGGASNWASFPPLTVRDRNTRRISFTLRELAPNLTYTVDERKREEKRNKMHGRKNKETRKKGLSQVVFETRGRRRRASNTSPSPVTFVFYFF
jgi:hypothetical protein